MRSLFRPTLLALVLWGRPLCAATEPLPLAEAMHERSALAKAMTTQFPRPGEDASAYGSHSGLNLAVALLLVTAVVFLKLAPRLKQRFAAWIPKSADPADLALSLLEEPSVAAFFDSLKNGPIAASACALARPPACAAAPADPLPAFYDLAPRCLADLRKLLSQISAAPTVEAQRTKLVDAFHRAGALRERAALPELLPVWQVAFALEELLKQIQRKESNVTHSALRTSAGALDLLGELCSRRVRPDLVTKPPVRMLAIDDDVISRRAVSLALKKTFGEPELAADGPGALVLAKQQAYDLIFLDVEMPGMDGFELCSKIHETATNRSTPVVFVTSHGDFDSRAKSAAVGAHDLIAKPFLSFEITVKALTLALKARLAGNGSKDALSATEAPAPGAGGAAGATEAASPFLSDSQPAPTPAPVTTATGAQPPAKSPPVPRNSSPGKFAGEFFELAQSRLQFLRKHLASARQARDSAARGERLSELFTGVHQLCLEAARAQHGAVVRVGSALEAMLRKLLDRPKFYTPSTLKTAEAARDVLDELCHAGMDLNVAHPPARILVVDDDAVARRGIGLALQLGFGRPEFADCGQAALALAANKPYDLIFLDVIMPGMDGFTACAKLRETPPNRLTPVVFVTNRQDTDAREQAAASGGSWFIPKPVLSSEITLLAVTLILRCRLESLKTGAGEPCLPADATTVSRRASVLVQSH